MSLYKSGSNHVPLWCQPVTALRVAGLIDTTDPGMAGASWLKNREVGEAVGEFFYGPANSFRNNELLLPKGWENLFSENGQEERG
jgi:hypothetical protein